MAYKIAFCGTPEFAVPALKTLIEDMDFQIEMVLTQPDRPSGRGKKLTASPVKKCAENYNLPVWTPEKVSEILSELEGKNLDLAVVVAYGQLLPEEFLQSFSKGCVNIHSSLLPRWRGAAPMQRAIMAGDKKTGVSLQKIIKKLDAGDLIGERAIDLPIDMGCAELYEKLKNLGCDLLQIDLKKFLKDEVSLKAQDEEQMTYAKKIFKTEAQVDWKLSSYEVHNKVRGLNMGGPYALTAFQGKTLKLHKTLPVDFENKMNPGTIAQILRESFVVSCGEGQVEVFEVQPENKAKMKAGDFIRGYHIKEGDSFGEDI